MPPRRQRPKRKRRTRPSRRWRSSRRIRPEKLEDWPEGKAKYETLGGPEGTHTYEEGPEKNLGPSGVRHHEDGSVSIDGEKVDNPDDYKGEPIPGGPTDPNAQAVAGEKDENADESGAGDDDG